MVGRIAIIVLLVLILAFLVHLTIQVKKGKTVVFVFGKLNLSDLTKNISTVTVPAIVQSVQTEANIVGYKTAGFLKGITY